LTAQPVLREAAVILHLIWTERIGHRFSESEFEFGKFFGTIQQLSNGENGEVKKPAFYLPLNLL